MIHCFTLSGRTRKLGAGIFSFASVLFVGLLCLRKKAELLTVITALHVICDPFTGAQVPAAPLSRAAQFIMELGNSLIIRALITVGVCFRVHECSLLSLRYLTRLRPLCSIRRPDHSPQKAAPAGMPFHSLPLNKCQASTASACKMRSTMCAAVAVLEEAHRTAVQYCGSARTAPGYHPVRSPPGQAYML